MQNSVDGIDGSFPQERRQVRADVTGRHSGQLSHVERRGDVKLATHHVEDGFPSVLVGYPDGYFAGNQTKYLD